MNERRQSDDKKPTKNLDHIETIAQTESCSNYPIEPSFHYNSQLTELRPLSNSLTNLLDSIGGLEQLAELYIHNNKLTKLPDYTRGLALSTEPRPSYSIGNSMQ